MKIILGTAILRQNTTEEKISKMGSIKKNYQSIKLKEVILNFAGHEKHKDINTGRTTRKRL